MPSHETTRYDRPRVARLGPIKQAVDRLGLPPIRMRKLRGLLNALEMQIEDGGDSPTVNALLLDALRAGVRHQVDERAAQGVLRAIDDFARDEARRWEQVRAGTLPPIGLLPEERTCSNGWPSCTSNGPNRRSGPPSPLVLPAKKPGRNDPCWCGSGKKYTQCHLDADIKAR